MWYLFNFPTWLTFFRIFLTPWIVYAICYNIWICAFVLFSCAMITDFFDGYYARLYKQETQFGALLDATADKILIFGTLLALYQISDQRLLPYWFVASIIGKDVILVFGALFLLLRKKYQVIAPSTVSKWFTALLMLFFVYLMLIHYQIARPNYVHVLIQFFMILIIIVLYDYVYKFFERL